MPNRNNLDNLPVGHFTAHIGLYCNYASYFSDYQKAVDIPFQSVAATETNPDSVAFSLPFLMRHSLELGYKFTLETVHRDAGGLYMPAREGHSLVRCHERLGKWFKEICNASEISAELIKDFDKYYELARVGMQEFDRLDPDSSHFRYPTDKKGSTSCFARTDKTNLLDLKTAFDGAMTLLRNTAAVFDAG
jgi:hypothetical protein